MNILFVGAFLPYTFSENLCNAKLVYALQEAGIHVDVISRKNEGPTYSKNWEFPWLTLKKNTHEIQYQIGNKIERYIDTLISSLQMGVFPTGGIRWARRAYQEALRLHKANHYDAILTRSPNDISHLIGYCLSQETGIKWIANWNDPAAPIWPAPYTHQHSYWEQKQALAFTKKCLKHADINTFPSQTLLEHFKIHFPFLEELHTKIIPHIGLSSTLFPQYNVLHKKSEFRMCHSGNLSKERNPELLFKAIKDLIDKEKFNISLDIMGYINDYIQTLIKKYDLTEHIRFIGNHPYIESIQKISEYDVSVLIEATMGKGIFFPSKFTDYAQIGNPILAISPAKGFAHDMLQYYGGGIAVNNEDYQSIRQGLQILYQTWENNNLKQKYNTKELFNNFTSQKVVSIYQSLLKC